MKKSMTKAIAILMSAAFMAGFTACSGGTEGDKGESTTTTTLEGTEAEIKDPAEESATSETTVETSVETTPEGFAEKTGGASASVFQEANLIKVGEHTYYPDYLFDNDRDKKFKDYILSVWEESDKDLHDDIFIYVIMESETKDEFRFSAKTIMDGVILEEAEMQNWYSPEAGYVWDYDFSKYRRCDINKSNILPVEEASRIVYEDAKANSYKMYKGSTIWGTFLLKSDGFGNLYYEFTVNYCSLINVDAKTGDIIQARYWDGKYT